MEDTVDTIEQPEVDQQNEPIYKTKDGQTVTHTQLLASGYDEDRISKGLKNNVITKIGDTQDPNQTFQTKDGQKVTTQQLIQSGYTQDRIDKGVHNGILSPLEKKNQVGDVGSTISSNTKSAGVTPSTSKEDLNTPIPKVDISNPHGNDPNDFEGNRPAEDSPIQLAKYAKELEDRTTTQDIQGREGFTEQVPDQPAVDYAKGIKKELQDKGYDADQLNKEFSDFPQEAFQHPETSETSLLQLRKDNPIAYQQLLNETKNQYAVKHGSIDNGINNPNYNAGNDYIGNDNEIHPQDLQSFYGVMQKKQQLIDANLSGDENEKAHQRLEQTYAPTLNATNPELLKEYENSDLKDKVDANQYAALKQWQVFEPEKYQQALNIINQSITKEYQDTGNSFMGKLKSTTDSTQGGEERGTTIDQAIGKEAIMRQLTETGRSNAIIDLTKEQHNLETAFNNSQDENEKIDIQQKYLANQGQINSIKDTEKQDDQLYPLTAKLKFDRQVKEITNDAGMGAFEYGTRKFASSMMKPSKSVEDMVTNMFGSDAAKTKLQMQRLGEGGDWNTQMYLPENYRSEGSPVILQPSNDLQKQADAILKGRSLSSLSDPERQQLNELVAKNQDKIETITNPDAGKSKNFFSKSTLFSTAGFMGDIAALAAQSSFMGGLGAGKIATNVVPLGLSSISDFHDEAVKEGKSPADATAYGILHGGVMMLAGAISPKWGIVKRSVGINTAAGKFLSGISEDTWNKIVGENSGVLNKITKAIKGTASEAAGMTATYGVGTSIMNDLVDKGFFNKNISGEDMVNHALQASKDLLFSSSGLLGLNLLTHSFKGTSLTEKAALWELGDNPDIGKAKIDEAVQRNDITPEEGERRKKAIGNISSLISKVPIQDDKGKPMTDQKKVEYLYNLVIQDKAKTEAKDLPPTQSEKVEEKGMVADYKNQLILNPKTDIQLENRKTQLEKLLEIDSNEETKSLSDDAKKDINAELSAINDEIDNRKKNSLSKKGNDVSVGDVGALKDVDSTTKAISNLHNDKVKELGDIVSSRVEYDNPEMELTKKGENDFLFELQNRNGEYSKTHDVVTRIKNHTPNWSNFREDIEEWAKKIVNVTVGDFNNSDARKSKIELDDMQKEYPDVKFINVDINEGNTLKEAQDKIDAAINSIADIPQSIAEKYHNEKSGGQLGKKPNPELVKAVEDAIGKSPLPLTDNKSGEGKIVDTKNAIMYGSYGDKAKVGDKEITLPKPGFYISHVELKSDAEKGKGNGQEVYMKALKEHGRLYSTSDVFPISEDAQRVQDALEKKGLITITPEKINGVDFKVIEPKSPLLLTPDKGVEEPVNEIKNEENKATEIPNPQEKGSTTETKPTESVSEATEPEKKTGVKRAVTDETRAENVLPKVYIPKMSSDTKALQEAKERVDSGTSNPRELVNRILDKKEGYHSDKDVMDMQYYAHQLATKEADLSKQLSQTDNEVDRSDIVGQQQQLSDEIDRQTQAAQIAGNQWSQIGNRMQPVIDMGFNISRERNFIKEAYGGEIPKEVKEQIDSISKERDAAIAEKNRVEELLRQKMAKDGFSKMQEDARKQSKRQQDKADLKKEEQDLIQELKKSLKKDLGNINSGIPIPKETLETLGKLVVNYIKQGVKSLEDLVDNIHAIIKEDAPNVTKYQIRNVVAEYTETNRLNKKAEGVEEKIANKEVSVKRPNERLKFEKSNEWTKANQRVINAEYKMQKLKRVAFNSEKNMYQKGLMWASKLTRASVLSGYNVFYKLAAAATIGGAGKRISEQVIGKIYQHLFKAIAEKAPIEGNLNVHAEAKFYKEFFNPKKFAKNTWEILKTGQSDLGKKFDNRIGEDLAEITVPNKPTTIAGKIGKGSLKVLDKVLSLPTDAHMMIKDPVKRATYEASKLNATVWAAKNGLDINDPLVINTIENAAYKRANYEIFQEKNDFSKWLNKKKEELDKGGNLTATEKFLVDFLLPVSTVPTNIARRVMSTSPVGLLRGNIKVIEAYRKGIESLTNEQADKIIRQLKQGTVGTALWLIGWYGASHFGGLYSKYNPDKKKNEGELTHDEMEVNGEMIPKPVQHALPFEIIQLAATARHIYDNYTHKGDSDLDALFKAALGSAGAIAEQIPAVDEASALIQSTKNPYEAEKFKKDIKRRFEPQILRDTGVIPNEKKEKSDGSGDHARNWN